MKTAALILLLFAAWWWFCYPAPTRPPVEQPTGIELRIIRQAQKKLGNYVIVLEEGRRVMVTSYGKVRL